MKKLLLPLVLLISTCSQPAPPVPEKLAVTQEIGEINIIPKPQLVERLAGQFELTGKTIIVAADEHAANAASAFNQMLAENYGLTLEIRGAAEAEGAIVFSTAQGTGENENYILRIEPGFILVTGSPRGMFYGAQSLFQLLPAVKTDSVIIPAGQITDSPRFRYRGAHLENGESR